MKKSFPYHLCLKHRHKHPYGISLSAANMLFITVTSLDTVILNTNLYDHFHIFWLVKMCTSLLKYIFALKNNATMNQNCQNLDF